MESDKLYESDKLPPRKMALEQKVLRAHYTALIHKIWLEIESENQIIGPCHDKKSAGHQNSSRT